uniref:Nuclear envelope phosphatase-regulatory subunit 1 n=1 Tax=Phascolarctos cinereus TaxID=38626 RepID=A0A6P5K7B8_PHACI|nr:nuclear envelope phosphatase-regulatory subunit 1 isoform X2 [Phascolarctos cinereus]
MQWKQLGGKADPPVTRRHLTECSSAPVQREEPDESRRSSFCGRHSLTRGEEEEPNPKMARRRAFSLANGNPDLKAFERRLTEYISCLQPATGRWRMILIVVSVCTATGAWNWLIDPETQKVSFFTSLWNHPFFTISCITLIGLFFAGIHKRVVAPSIIAARCRTVLAEYNMSCDDTGKLILKPRPHVQ